MMQEDAFVQAAERYQNMIWRLALHVLRSHADADDITQEVLLRLYRSGKDFADENHLRFWLVRVTINCCKKALLSPWRKMEPLEDFQEKLSVLLPERSELFDAVMGLSHLYRVPLYLYYYEGYSTEEIGRLLHIPRATVATRLHRGRALLRDHLKEESE